jgi:hypothetical protein
MALRDTWKYGFDRDSGIKTPRSSHPSLNLLP